MFNSRNEMINYFKDREERKYLNWNQNKNINNNNDFDNEFTFTNYVPLKFKQTTKQIISSEKKINSNDNFDKNQKEKTKNFSPFSKSTLDFDNDNTFSNYSHINKGNPNIETSRILFNYKNKKNIPRWDYLYLTSKSPKTYKNQLTTKQLKENQELEECTFKPEIIDIPLNVSSTRTNKRSVNKVVERMHQWDKQNQKRIKEMKSQLDEKKYEECIFKPNTKTPFKNKSKNHTKAKNQNEIVSECNNLTEFVNFRKTQPRSYSNNYNLGKSNFYGNNSIIKTKFEFKLNKTNNKNSRRDFNSKDTNLKHIQNSSFSKENPNDTSIYDLKDISLREYTHKKLYNNNNSWFKLNAFKRPVSSYEMKEILDQYNSNSNVSLSNINLTDDNDDQFRSDDNMNKFIKPTTSNYSFYSCKDSLFKVDQNLVEYEKTKEFCRNFINEKEKKLPYTNLNSSNSTYTSNSLKNQVKLKNTNRNNLTNKTTNKSTPFNERSMTSYTSSNYNVPIYKKLDSKDNFIMNPLDYVYEKNKNKEVEDKSIINEKNFNSLIEKLHNDIVFLDI